MKRNIAANTTARAVNVILPQFCKRFPTPQSSLEVSKGEIISFLPGINHPGHKAEYIQVLAAYLHLKRDIPHNIEEFTPLKGSGRNTAAVILALV